MKPWSVSTDVSVRIRLIKQDRVIKTIYEMLKQYLVYCHNIYLVTEVLYLHEHICK